MFFGSSVRLSGRIRSNATGSFTWRHARLLSRFGRSGAAKDLLCRWRESFARFATGVDEQRRHGCLDLHLAVQKRSFDASRESPATGDGADRELGRVLLQDSGAGIGDAATSAAQQKMKARIFRLGKGQDQQ